MKRLLTLVASTLFFTTYAIQPTEMPDMRLSGISANGIWAAGSDENAGTFVIVNLDNGEEYWYGPDTDEQTQYTAGLGKFVSDNGIVLATAYETDEPCYWENEEWHQLPLRKGDFGAYPNAITPDGSRITGSVSKSPMSLDATNIMNVPVVWNRNALGSYDVYVEIPHPSTDWTGRTPQYILIDDISADGRVLAGDLVDYSGFTQQPIVFTEDETGQWTYTLLHPELTNPDNVEFPKYPGEAPEEPSPVSYMTPANAEAYTALLEAWETRPMPEQFDYMTVEEYEAYMQAIDAFYIDNETNPYPLIEDYMTPEEIQAYRDAIDAYYDTKAPDPMDYLSTSEYQSYAEAHSQWEKEFREWAMEYNAFDDVFWTALVNPKSISYLMNSARISYNGRYYMMGTETYSFDPTSPTGVAFASTPIIFDLEDGTYTLLDQGEKDILGTMVFDNGAVLGGTPTDEQTRSAAISPAAGEPFVMLADWLKDKAPETYKWVEQNMMQDVMKTSYVYNEKTGVYDEVVTIVTQLVTGTPVASRDMKTIATWAYNVWDLQGPDYVSYILPLNPGANGIVSVGLDSENCLCSLDSNGYLTLGAGIVGATIYDVNGRQVYTSTVSAFTGLSRGIYIVKAITAEGKTHITKSTIL